MLQKPFLDSLYDQVCAPLDRAYMDYCLSVIPKGMKTALLIDAPNFHMTQKALGVERDYYSFFRVLRQYFTLFPIYYFFGKSPIQEDADRQMKAASWLARHNVRILFRESTRVQKPDGTWIAKGNMDVQITVTALTECQNVDNIILATGDKDFLPLLQKLKERGQMTTILSSEKAGVNILSPELRLSADLFIDLDWINTLIKEEHKEIEIDQYIH